MAEFSRKHTVKLHESQSEIRGRIDTHVKRRDERCVGFVNVIRKAIGTRLAEYADEALKVLSKHGFTSKLAKEALEVARQRGVFTVFPVVDAHTRLASRLKNVGDRSEADTRASALLVLAT